MRPLLCLAVLAAVSGAIAGKPTFNTLQDAVGHYALKSCKRVLQKKGSASKLALLRWHETCDTLSERLEHMVDVSGNDAMIQLHNRDDADSKETSRKTLRRKKGAKPSRAYYSEVIRIATEGAHHQQLLKMLRKAAEWALALPNPPLPEDISSRLQPEVGQWLINVASRSDPHVTSKEMRDEDPEELLD